MPLWVSPPRIGSAATNPTTSNDGTQGYAIGSLFVNTVTGITWVARSVGTGAAIWVPLAPGNSQDYISGRYYSMAPMVPISAGSAHTAGTLYLMPMPPLLRRSTFDALLARVTTLSAVGAGGDVCQIGVYRNDAALGRPTGTPIASLVGLSTTAATTVSGVLGASATLEEGEPFWVAAQINNTTAALAAPLAALSPAAAFTGSTTVGNIITSTGTSIFYFTFANTYGTFPDLTGQALTEVATGTTHKVPILGMRAA